MRQAIRIIQIGDVAAKPSSFSASPLHVFCGAALIGAALLVAIYGMLFGITSETRSFVVFGVGLYLAGASVAAFRLHRDFPHKSLGMCNLVTLVRLLIVGMLFASVMAGITPTWATFAIAALALSLDGIDGWLARKQGLASDFGAAFDVEVDALFALILALYAATSGATGAFVILLGLPHYLFWIARVQVPWLNQPLRPSLRRKAVCVLQIGALVALQIPVFDDGQLDVLIAAATLALIWSFGRDILWLRSRMEARV